LNETKTTCAGIALTAEAPRWLYYLAAAALALLLTLPFLGLFVANDVGFYGFFSRAMADGFAIHRDFPMGQNSLSFIINAEIFKLFGPSLLVFRLIYAVWGILFALAFFNLAEKAAATRWQALVLSAAAFLLEFLPHLQYGLGSNNLLPVLFFLTICARAALYENSSGAALLGGLCAGAAAGFNESLFSFAPFALACFMWGKGRAEKALFWTLGFAAACVPFALTLMPRGAWTGYMRDMFYLGVGARVAGGAYANRVESIIGMGGEIAIFYGGLILFNPLKKDRRFLTFFLGLCFTVLVVNATRNYHLTLLSPFMALGAWAAAEKLFLHAAPIKRGEKIRLWAAALLCALLTLPAAAREYFQYQRVSEAGWRFYASGDRAAPPDNDARLVTALDTLPYETIAAMSQYPALFLADRYSISKPFTEDISVAGNSSGMISLSDLINGLRTNPADVYAGKRLTESPSHNAGFLRLFLKDRYLRIADFINPNPFSVPRYRFCHHDIYYSEKAFARYFEKTSGITVKPNNFRAVNATVQTFTLPPVNRTRIIEAVLPRGVNLRAEMTSAKNRTYYIERFMPRRFYILARAGENVTLALWTRKPPSVTLNFYTIKPAAKKLAETGAGTANDEGGSKHGGINI